MPTATFGLVIVNFIFQKHYLIAKYIDIKLQNQHHLQTQRHSKILKFYYIHPAQRGCSVKVEITHECM